MSPFSRCCILGLFLLSFRSVAQGNFLSFSVENFGKVSDFDSQVALLGNAEFVNGTNSVRISGSGRLICKRPFTLITNLIAFSTHIAFSLSGDRGFDFLMLPHADGFADLSRKKNDSFAVEFDGNRGGADVESRASFFRRKPAAGNVSVTSVKLRLRSGEKLSAWINYEATGKRLEISLSKNGGGGRNADKDLYIPLVSYPIDFSSIWKQQQILVGIISSSSTSATEIYSWSFESRNLENTSHSEPMNTESFKATSKEVGNENKDSEDGCGSRIVAALAFGIGCGAMGGLFLVFLWRLFGGKRLVVPEVIVDDDNGSSAAAEKTMIEK
ncbi:hypothetical protein M569_02242 [Genlisea aurea]|uniref:Legume lectin domain-containing protein n=1 Tax=Genlisea aurea TaxID=192259 RepID=S8D541_9LAMI|nr:hypothetical protein M569_02242 [Genlisea aurea]